MLSRQALIASVLLVALAASCGGSPAPPDMMDAGPGDAARSATGDAHEETTEGGDTSVGSTESDGESGTDGVADGGGPYDASPADAGKGDARPPADAPPPPLPAAPIRPRHPHSW